MSQSDARKVVHYYEEKLVQLHEDLEVVNYSVTKTAIMQEIIKIEKALADKNNYIK
ncbi:hypothetical protein [Priestia flexa]|uniref:Uncharacterized protein n=1 Tax=Priestia flexa TaxID=86664 RepID=A0A8I1SQL7_9BACI|nr:hypothetical protein [Priestia flexa]MBN8253863.1 hypothetical protein [Priestia flexa]